MKQLFPKEFIERTIEHYTFRISTKNSVIYWIILASLGVVIVLLPLVKIEVTQRSRGSISTTSDRHEIRGPASGMVSKSFLVENVNVNKGDTLLVFDQTHLNIEKNELLEQKRQKIEFLKDLNILLSTENLNDHKVLRSSLYQVQFLKYASALERLELDVRNAERRLRRQKLLFEQKVIPEIEYENYLDAFKESQAELTLLKRQWSNNWQEEVIQNKDKLRQIDLRLNQLEIERSRYVIIAANSGELQNVQNTSVGQNLMEGQFLAELSFRDDLHVTCWITPGSIGLLHEGMAGKFSIDAYDHHEWGFVNGVIEHISESAYNINQQSLFKVECSLEKDNMTLSNGYIGYLKKGMSLEGHFKITDRSIWNLLQDEVEDWLDPRTQSI